MVITGGSRGLGMAMARDEEELQRAAANVLHFETEVSIWPCDARDELNGPPVRLSLQPGVAAPS